MNTISDQRDSMLKLQNVSKTYQGGEVRTTALDRINLEIDAGVQVRSRARARR